MYYVIEVSDIELCSKNGIVACWDEDLDKPIILVSDVSKTLFADNETVERD